MEQLCMVFFHNSFLLFDIYQLSTLSTTSANSLIVLPRALPACLKLTAFKNILIQTLANLFPHAETYNFWNTFTFIYISVEDTTLLAQM